MLTTRPPTSTPALPSNDHDERLDEALEETFPASDPVELQRREKLPPPDAPGSDIDDQ